VSYQQFFKKASEAKKDTVSFKAKPKFSVKRPQKSSEGGNTPKGSSRLESDAQTEARLRKAVNFNVRKKHNPFPWKAFGGLAITLGVLCTYLMAPDFFENFAHRIEVNAIGGASAAEKSTAPAVKSEKAAASQASANPDQGIEAKAAVPEDLSHFGKLKARKDELDMREKELSELEEELQKQKVELDKRIVQLEDMRNQIAQILKDRVEVDQEKVSKLVDLYSNMKPKQAADVIGSINEDLAVEVLAKMKKKNAAEIMNLLPAEKARTLSEKYTGYKRKMEEPKG
jgi:flagellar motility protein MotE (MotC chaperone)